nr:hypothetical protein [Tanacetum cinerariifolium]
MVSLIANWERGSSQELAAVIIPQWKYENYLCNLCGNKSHDGYDCQQQFPFVYEQKSSYNQNYDDNYYSHESQSFPCCDNCGGSHETFQCQPIAQNIDFSGSDQIQTPRYPDVHPPSQETSDEVFQANHSIQNGESFENPSNEIVVSNSNQEKEEPPQDSNIRQLIREECCVKASEEHKQNMEDTMLESVKICQEKEFICIHDNVDDLIEKKEEPPQDSNIRQLVREECCVKASEEHKQNMEDTMLESVKICQEKEFLCIHDNVDDLIEITPILSTKEPEHLLSMGYEHLSITPETEYDKVTESNAENLLPIPSECEVTLEDKRDCDVPVSTIDVCDNHSDIFSDSKIDDDISVYNDDFEDIEYVEASLFDREIVSVEEENGVEEENVVQKEEEEVDLEDMSQIQDVVLREKLLSITRLIANIESLNDNSTPDRVLNSFESNNSLLNYFSPEFETFCDHTEETRSGNTTRADNSLPEYDSFCFEIEPDEERLINLMKNDIFDYS